MRPALGLAFWLALTFGAAALGARFMPGPWYQALAKPSWTPPGWVFGPVWTVLYALMAVAAWLVWRRTGTGAPMWPLALYVAQLALNAAWSWLFFGLRDPGLALADIAVLWTAIVATTAAFWAIRPLAGALLLPYLAWVSFAWGLNFAIWRLNP